MFTKKEGSFLRKLLNVAIDKQRELVEKSAGSKDAEAIENELITLVSSFNKIKRDVLNSNKTDVAPKAPKILLVDDIESMREITRRMLMKMELRKVDEAKSAEHAMRKLNSAIEKDDPYDLVITDWEMPGDSGLDLLKDIRLSEAMSEIDVYILTSHSSQKNIVSAINAGVTGYLVKPVNFKIMQNKFSQYVIEEDD